MSATTIIISKDTRNTLKKLGFKGETYDEIISKLIKLSEPCLVRKERKDIGYPEYGKF